MQIEWEVDKSRYASGERARLGKWEIGGVYYDSCTSQGDGKKWRALCSLPQIKPILGNFVTVEEAKERVEKAVAHWVSEAGIAKENT